MGGTEETEAPWEEELERRRLGSLSHCHVPPSLTLRTVRCGPAPNTADHSEGTISRPWVEKGSWRPPSLWPEPEASAETH